MSITKSSLLPVAAGFLGGVLSSCVLGFTSNSATRLADDGATTSEDESTQIHKVLRVNRLELVAENGFKLGYLGAMRGELSDGRSFYESRIMLGALDMDDKYEYQNIGLGFRFVPHSQVSPKVDDRDQLKDGSAWLSWRARKRGESINLGSGGIDLSWHRQHSAENPGGLLTHGKFGVEGLKYNYFEKGIASSLWLSPGDNGRAVVEMRSSDSPSAASVRLIVPHSPDERSRIEVKDPAADIEEAFPRK